MKTTGKAAEFEASTDGHGSIWLLRPLTDGAREWVAESIPADAQWFGGAVAVEHRYIGDILQGLKLDGFGVRVVR